MSKLCSKCGENKDVGDFYKRKNRPSGLMSQCKQCQEKTKAEWGARNPEKKKAMELRFYKKVRDRILPAARIRANARYKANKEKLMEQSKAWAKANPEKRRDHANRCARKYRSTPKGKINDSMATGIHTSIKNGAKAGRHWETLVNFTVDQLKQHLEKHFTPEMTWENYGTVWEIDHKIPIAVFNFETPEHIDFRLCWSLKNLQPLGRYENRSKGAKLGKPFQPSLALAM